MINVNNELKRIRLWVSKAYDYINGKINNIASVGYTLNFDPDAENLGGERNGYITFYMIPIQKIGRQIGDVDSFKTMISFIVAHELSHIDQAIDYKRYADDIQYMKTIELENNKRAISWVVSNALPLREAMGGFNVNFIMLYAQHAKINGIANPIDPVYETIRTQIEPLMGKRFDDVMNVVLMISNKNHGYTNLIVKRDGYLGDVNQIMYTLREIWRYNDFKYMNEMPDPYTLCIMVFVDDDNMYLERHMHSLA